MSRPSADHTVELQAVKRVAHWKQTISVKALAELKTVINSKINITCMEGKANKIKSQETKATLDKGWCISQAYFRHF
jgi:hypothetical protein